MSPTTARPCKRPQVSVEPHATAAGAYSAVCHVPGCSWNYGTRPHQAVKTDAEHQAVRHRAEHRAAVPKTRITHDLEYDVHCEPCGGHRRTFDTRTDAQAWLDYHLSAEHGLVVCT